MRVTSSGGIGIAYEVIGEGPPIVLLHGGAADRSVWVMEGWVERLSDRMVVLMDARGHGRSDHPTEPAAYSPAADASDVIAVLDAIGLRSAVLCGFSMGARMALITAALHPSRVTAVAGLGAPAADLPFADTIPPNPDDGEAFAAALEAHVAREAVDSLIAEGRPGWAELFGRADWRALAARVRGDGTAPRLEARLQDLVQPLLLAWGAVDVFGEGNERLALPPGAERWILPGLDHVGILEQPDLVLPRVCALGAPVP